MTASRSKMLQMSAVLLSPEPLPAPLAPCAWPTSLALLKAELPAQQFDAWIRPLTVARSDALAGTLELGAPNHFVAQWVREKFLVRIEGLVSNAWQQPAQVLLTVVKSNRAGNSESISVSASVPTEMPVRHERQRTLKGEAPLSAASLGDATTRFKHTRLNPTYTLDEDCFVKGNSNQLTLAAAQQVARNLSSAYNPLFIYGGVGLGKTHLLQGIGNHVFKGNPAARVRYVHAEQFVTDVVKAYSKKSFDELKRYYHSLDVLLIDDIQFFSGKDRTQQEFFYTFNALLEAQKQVVITCDTFPKEMVGVEDRLKSRFSWGLTVAIDPPELEHRVAILQNKAKREGLALDEATAFFVAKHVRASVRELEGALKKLQAYSEFHGRAISMESAKDALRDLISVQRRQVSLDNIQKTVAEYYRIKVAEMFSKKRTADLVKPRQIAMFLAKEMTSLSLPEIGAAFGGRDHTTVIHAVRKIAEARKTDSALNHELHVLEQTLKG